QLEPGGSVYNLPVAVRLKGSLDLSALSKSFDEIVRRHEILRTTFIEEEGRTFQIINPPFSVDMPVLDRGAVFESEREAPILRLAYEEAEQPFDLAAGPLIRVRILRIDDND